MTRDTRNEDLARVARRWRIFCSALGLLGVWCSGAACAMHDYWWAVGQAGLAAWFLWLRTARFSWSES